MSELAAWPETLLEKLFGGLACASASAMGRQQRFLELVEHGLIMHTDFSGKQCPEVSLRMVDVALHKRGINLADEWLVCWRACAIAPECQRLMLANTRPPEHVFKELLACAPMEIQDGVRQCRPTRHMSSEQKEAAYLQMDRYLTLHRSSAFARARLAPAGACLRHPLHRCPASWVDSDAIEPEVRPVTCMVAGTMCTPWTMLGQRTGLAHEATEPWLLWVNEQAEVGFDLVTLENSEWFPLHLFTDKMDRSHHVVACKIGVEDLVARRCNYCSNLLSMCPLSAQLASRF